MSTNALFLSGFCQKSCEIVPVFPYFLIENKVQLRPFFKALDSLEVSKFLLQKYLGETYALVRNGFSMSSIRQNYDKNVMEKTLR
jgi:hypothetical protein